MGKVRVILGILLLDVLLGAISMQTAPIRSFTKHAEDVTCMAVCTNTASTVVASGGYDGVVFVWGLDCSVKHEMRAASLSTTDSDNRQALEMRSLSGGTKSKQGRTSGANSALAVLHIPRRRISTNNVCT